ncbi:hypothetical protein N177_0985 [Lutibaculum baratangense AMV1]|uniref:Uncharacterized protein n=1 Tax=Lutibaculum baratangense AMV1 TaxID=631454 RepID=V4RTS4_9HYPH|nr:hypothetical protein N177_0985 [Lutibaculum baratangense AMV1]
MAIRQLVLRGPGQTERRLPAEVYGCHGRCQLLLLPVLADGTVIVWTAGGGP